MENKRTLQNSPQYFGAYLNMARHNVFVINNHLAEKFNKAPLPSEEHIADSFLTKKITEKPNHIFSHLIRFLSIAKVFDPERLPKTEQKEELAELQKKGKDFDALSKYLKLCFKELNDFRNDYSHYFSTEKQTKRKIIFDDQKLVGFLKTNFLRAIEYSKQRFTGVFEEKHFEIAKEIEKDLVGTNNEISEKGLVFFTCLFLDRENAFQFINKIIGFKDTRTPEFKATREVFSAFCINLPHDRFISEDPEQAFVLDMLSELNRCPSELFNCLTAEGKKLFQPTLDTQQRTNITDNNDIARELPEEDFDDYIQSITKKIRFKDRFPYFALKFVDTTKALDKIRFQIDLGKFQLTEYKKPFNNTEENRAIIENAKAFGRLDDFIDEEKIEKTINKSAIENAGFEQFAPHYNIEQNKIGFRFFPNGTSDPIYPKLKKSDNDKSKANINLLQNAPHAFFSIHELPKVVLLELLEKGKAEELIGKYINANKSEILNKDFIQKIKNELKFERPFYKRFQRKNEPAYSEKNLDELKNRKNALDKILKPYNLNHKQIPSRIVNYWIEIKEIKDVDVIANRIQAMKKDCVERLKDKKKGKAPKIGEMATFLAKDIVDMVIDEKVKKKITSFYYDKMQECLALFADPEKKQLFMHICSKELGLFNKEIGHPFLSDVNVIDIKYTQDFYEKYLTVKGDKSALERNSKTKKDVKKDISWLYLNFYKKERNSQRTKIVLPDDMSKLPFSIRNLTKNKSNFDNWLNNVTKGKMDNDKAKPIDLPTNLFDDALVIALRKNLDAEKKTYKPNDKYFYLLKQWMGSDDIQPFYKEEREYNVFEEKINFRLDTKQTMYDYFKDHLRGAFNRQEKKRIEKERLERKILPQIQKQQIIDVFNNAITENEKEIRFIQERDRVLLLMIKSRLKSGGDAAIKLSQIADTLNETIKIQESVTGKLPFNDKGEFIQDKDKKEITKTITAQRKRKEFTLFKKFISDRRLPGLFEYFNEEEIPYSKLEQELKEYNKIKELVFDKAFKMEEIIIKEGESRVKELFTDERGKKKEGNIQHKPYLSWLSEKGFVNAEQVLFLNAVRNAFAHNQFPPKVCMKGIMLNEHASFARQIYDKYITEVNSVLEKISTPNFVG